MKVERFGKYGFRVELIESEFKQVKTIADFLHSDDASVFKDCLILGLQKGGKIIERK